MANHDLQKFKSQLVLSNFRRSLRVRLEVDFVLPLSQEQEQEQEPSNKIY